MPELELGESSDERSEFFVLFRRQGGFTVLETLVLRQAGIELRLEKGEEKVEEVDAKAVGHDVPPLGEDYAEEEEDEDGSSCRPSIRDIGRRLVKVGLVLSYQFVALRTDSVKGSRLRLRPVHGGGSGRLRREVESAHALNASRIW